MQIQTFIRKLRLYINTCQAVCGWLFWLSVFVWRVIHVVSNVLLLLMLLVKSFTLVWNVLENQGIQMCTRLKKKRHLGVILTMLLSSEPNDQRKYFTNISALYPRRASGNVYKGVHSVSNLWNWVVNSYG